MMYVLSTQGKSVNIEMSNFDQVIHTAADRSECLAWDEKIPSGQGPSCFKNIWAVFFELFSKANVYTIHKTKCKAKLLVTSFKKLHENKRYS